MCKPTAQPDTHEPAPLRGQPWRGKLLWSLLPFYHLSPHMAHFIEASKPSLMLFPLPEASFPYLPAKSSPSMKSSLPQSSSPAIPSPSAYCPPPPLPLGSEGPVTVTAQTQAVVCSSSTPSRNSTHTRQLPHMHLVGTHAASQTHPSECLLSPSTWKSQSHRKRNLSKHSSSLPSASPATSPG